MYAPKYSMLVCFLAAGHYGWLRGGYMYYCNILAHQVQYYCTIAVNNLLVVPETPISPAQRASSLIVIARIYTREEYLTFLAARPHGHFAAPRSEPRPQRGVASFESSWRAPTVRCPERRAACSRQQRGFKLICLQPLAHCHHQT